MITNISDFSHALGRIKRCDQFWDDMKPHEQGRLCEKCSKTIIDFSGKSLEDIALTMANSEEPVCGFYRPEHTWPPPINIRKVAATLAAGVLMAQAEAAPPKEKAGTVLTEYDVAAPADTVQQSGSRALQADNFVIKGNIVDASGAPVAGCSVLLMGSNDGTVSDVDGQFSLQLGQNRVQDSFTLRFSTVGFDTIDKELFKDELQAVNDMGTITCHDSKDIIVYYVTVKAPWYKRAWYKMRKPFLRKM